MSQSEFGTIEGFNDFLSDEVAVAGTTAPPINLSGGFKLVGDGIADTDSGLVLQSALNGVGRLTTTNEANHTCGVGTEMAFDGQNGLVVFEARISLPAQTARRVFVGLTDAVIDAQVSAVTSSTTTHTLVASDLAGFVFDSGLTSKNWHVVFNGGSTTGETDSTVYNTGKLPVNGEFDVLRVEAFLNTGLCRFYVNGDLVATISGAVSTTVNFGVTAYVAATTTTIATADLDYVAYRSHRHWDRDNA